MIKKENITINGRKFIKTYSDAGLFIRKKGTEEIYTEAVDIINFEYEETAEKTEKEAQNG